MPIKAPNGYAEILVLLGLTLFAFILAGGVNEGIIQGGLLRPTPAPPPPVNLPTPPLVSAESSLQLGTLLPITITPTIPPTPLPPKQISIPTPTPLPPEECTADGPVSACSQCCADTRCGYACGKGFNGNPNEQCSNTWCDAEPILYLYPQVPTTVSVTLSVPGQITESTPLYPPGGWNNIRAFPDRTFLYHGHLYNELYYETAISPGTPPTRGIVVPRLDISKTVLQLITKLGLQPKEQDEFMQYWMKRLNTLSSPYLFISVFSPEEKEKIDRVTITPTPDTFIQFNFYFKPVSTFFSPPPLFLPSAPARKGFVVVEWGGILEN